MTDVLIKDVDAALEARLRDEAARGGGDLGEAARRLLEEALEGTARPKPVEPEPTEAELAAMPLGKALSRAFKPIREDPTIREEALTLLERGREWRDDEPAEGKGGSDGPT